ncbi:hypothetical protein [Myxacorys almedinensis]|uniref:Uncharacterized protein n=1 Tax=Myxacorys almedinensis A TaxID=2690445 RepID=A0A8J7Z6Y7_9CYAN|nr:hypothetical protein [Myxacorys almedinensis]NDJ19291.1 hypothetical protein [Myxacorys almedinensis A]
MLKISDLSYLEEMSENSDIEGGNYSFKYGNLASLSQGANATVGNAFGWKSWSIGNVAIALNIATITQISL